MTGGKVVYRRTIQPQPYESEGAEVELAFLIEDGETASEAIEEVLKVARAEVREALGLNNRRVRKDD